MSTGWVALWVPDSVITREEMAETGKAAIEAARAEGATSVTINFSPERQVTFARVVIRLPVFIESPDWREARDFADAIMERADRSLAN